MKLKHMFAVFVLVSLPTTILAADGIREGMWEITTKMEMPGMPMEMPPTTIKHCYTKEEVKDQKNMINRDKNCTIIDFKKSGNKVSWKTKCTGKNAGMFSGETVFSGDSYESVMTMQLDANKSHSAMNMKGKKIGDCP